ncbi:MAG: hypothetical protein ABSB59_42035 [Streptosporangiaceae bacterium]|jgi:hypothetical protein
MGALGWITHDGSGPGILHASNVDSGTVFVLEIMQAAFADVLLGLISGILTGALATSGTLTLDSAELMVTRRFITSRYRNGLLARPLHREVYFWIQWSVIERIAVEDSRRAEGLRVCFRHGHKPPAGWLMANAIRSRADGSFYVYRVPAGSLTPAR